MKTWRVALAISLSLASGLLATAAGSARADEASPSGEIGRDFRGKVVYKGTYSGSSSKTDRRGTSTQNLDGAFTITVTFDGAAAKAVAETTGLLKFGALSGVVSNGVCKLYDPELLEGRCDFSNFNAVVSYKQANQSGQFRFDGKAVSTEDFVVRDARRAAQAEEARKQAAAARAEELAARAKMRAQLPAGAAAKYKPILDRAVVSDAAHWFSNRYANGSLDLIGVHNDASSGSTFLKAYFQYVGGREGWVAAIVNKGGQVQCLQFWDDSSGCRGIGNGANAKMAAGFLAGMMSDGGQSSSGGCNAACQSDDTIRRNQNDYARQQAEADARMRAAGEAQRQALENRDAIGR